MKQNTKNLSPRGIAVEKFKKAAKLYDKDVSNGIEYEMMKLIDDDEKKRAMFDLKIQMLKEVKEFQCQYQRLFEDYVEATGKYKDEDYPFSVILKNPLAAYNKVTDLMNQFSKTY